MMHPMMPMSIHRKATINKNISIHFVPIAAENPSLLIANDRQQHYGSDNQYVI